MTKTGRRFAGVLALGAVVVVATVVLMYPKAGQSATNPNAKAKAKEEMLFLHCPKCDQEWKFDIDRAATPCEKCRKKLVPTSESIAKTGKPPGRFTKLFMVVYTELVGILAAVWLVTKPRAISDEEKYNYMWCPHCGQKMRYQDHQIGRPGACRRCKRAFSFPEVEAGA